MQSDIYCPSLFFRGKLEPAKRQILDFCNQYLLEYQLCEFLYALLASSPQKSLPLQSFHSSQMLPS